jgi:GDPmannose 4,6-dehydratase
MKTIFVIGSNGQDGIILSRLLNKNKIFGFNKKYIFEDNKKKKFNILKYSEVSKVIKQKKPDLIFYLATYNHSAEQKIKEDKNFFYKSLNVHFQGLFNFLENCRLYSPKTKIFYASSSQIFGLPISKPQNEKTTTSPQSIYGFTKLLGNNLCQYYRRKHKLFCCIGILYNHDSEFSSEKFLMSKLINGAIRISNKKQKKISIGNANNKIDIGYSEDYMRAAIMIMNHKKPNDYIISSNQQIKIINIIKYIFLKLKLNIKKHLKIDKKLIFRKSNNLLVGNNNFLKKEIKWKHKYNYKQMIDHILRKKKHG